jgi:hypothetical protein
VFEQWLSVRALSDKLGHEALLGLQTLLNDAIEKSRDDMGSISEERFERRLAQEIGTLRVDLAKEFAAVRTDTAKGFAEMRAELMKWSFLFWIGQFAAISGMMIFLFKTIGA